MRLLLISNSIKNLAFLITWHNLVTFWSESSACINASFRKKQWLIRLSQSWEVMHEPVLFEISRSSSKLFGTVLARISLRASHDLELKKLFLITIFLREMSLVKPLITFDRSWSFMPLSVRLMLVSSSG